MTDGDTIVAPATPRGRSAVAMIRISGPRARNILSKIFKAEKSPPEQKSWRVRTGRLVDAGEGSAVDQAMAVFMPGPATYTGEDLAEITCHGSTPVVDAVLQLCIAQGARLAEPGEFTRRAFTNGRVDLAEAEAVCDFISAETQASLDTARRQMSGELSDRIEGIRAGLFDAAAEIEARIDFPEEDVPEADRSRLTKALRAGISEIELLLRQGQRGQRLRDGARVAIVGRVNVGKSSIFNAIVGMERAISTPHPGTTRDTIEARLDIHCVTGHTTGTAANLNRITMLSEQQQSLRRRGYRGNIHKLRR